MVGRLRQAKSDRDANSDLSHEDSGKFENVFLPNEPCIFQVRIYFTVYDTPENAFAFLFMQRLGIWCTVYATNL